MEKRKTQKTSLKRSEKLDLAGSGSIFKDSDIKKYVDLSLFDFEPN